MRELQVRWVDPTGTAWNLDGSSGVRLDLNQEGLGWGKISHDFSESTGRLLSSRVDRQIIGLKVVVGENLSGDAFLDLHSRWWGQANSPFKGGVLEFRRGSKVRAKWLVLAESPGTVWPYNPAMEQERPVEPWLLIGNDPWWGGDLVGVSWDHTKFTTRSTPFYGPSGRGMPMHLSDFPSVLNPELLNEGQAPMWPVWTLQGPLTDAQVGVPGHVLVIQGVIPAGATLTIVTKPSVRAVTSSRLRNADRMVGGEFSAIPPGTRKLHVAARVVGHGARVSVSAEPLFAMPY